MTMLTSQMPALFQMIYGNQGFPQLPPPPSPPTTDPAGVPPPDIATYQSPAQQPQMQTQGWPVPNQIPGALPFNTGFMGYWGPYSQGYTPPNYSPPPIGSGTPANQQSGTQPGYLGPPASPPSSGSPPATGGSGSSPPSTGGYRPGAPAGTYYSGGTKPPQPFVPPNPRLDGGGFRQDPGGTTNTTSTTPPPTNAGGTGVGGQQYSGAGYSSTGTPQFGAPVRPFTGTQQQQTTPTKPPSTYTPPSYQTRPKEQAPAYTAQQQPTTGGTYPTPTGTPSYYNDKGPTPTPVTDAQRQQYEQFMQQQTGANYYDQIGPGQNTQQPGMVQIGTYPDGSPRYDYQQMNPWINQQQFQQEQLADTGYNLPTGPLQQIGSSWFDPKTGTYYDINGNVINPSQTAFDQWGNPIQSPVSGQTTMQNAAMFSGNQPRIDANPILDDFQIQQLINKTIGQNALGRENRNLAAQRQEGLSGFAGGGSSLGAIQNDNRIAESILNAQAQSAIPIQAAQMNIPHILQAQMAQEGQFANRQKEAIASQGNLFSLFNPLLSLFGQFA